MFDWITGFMETTGYFGIALLMFAENVFPPIPSELIMPLAGFSAARGDLSLLLVILAGSAGSVAGALLWYGIGHWLGLDRLKRLSASHGRWLTLSPQEIDKVENFFSRHSGKVVLFGRLLPAVRTFISIPAGIAGMAVPKFLIYSTLGTFAWTAALAGAGYLFESEYAQISAWLNPAANAVLGGAVTWYLYRVVTFRSRTAPKR
jgi:membrane protein DedA with SNARE-associated domain